MKRTGQRGSGRPPIHSDINLEILPSEEDQVIIVSYKYLIHFVSRAHL